jgi:hypothetical protein
VVRHERGVERSWEFIERWVEDGRVTEFGDESTASAGDAFSEGSCKQVIDSAGDEAEIVYGN